MMHSLTNLKMINICILFFLGGGGGGHNNPAVSQGLLIYKVITLNEAPQSVGLLWTSDQLVAETST
jgi:glycerol uptake facilitator-like aquaporin